MSGLALILLLSALFLAFLFLMGLVVFLVVLMMKSQQTPLWILRDQMTENQLLRNQLRTHSISDLNGLNAATLPSNTVSNLTEDTAPPVGNDDLPVDFITVDDLQNEDIESVSTEDLDMMGWATNPQVTRNPDGSWSVNEPGL